MTTPMTAQEQINLEWDNAMRQARALADVMPEFRTGCSRDERITLANAIFIRNAIARLPRDIGGDPR